ncbi:hypothetical protein GCM10009122_42360 [Fulvivirga kasyanovii]
MQGFIMKMTKIKDGYFDFIKLRSRHVDGIEAASPLKYIKPVSPFG